MSLLDRYVPTWDTHEHHALTVAHPPDVAYRVARAVPLRAVPAMRLLFAARGLGLRGGGSARLPVLDWLVASGFARLAEGGDGGSAWEAVIGLIGRPWRVRAGVGRPRLAPASYASFGEPGWAVMALNLRCEPHPDGGALVSTETRVRLTDDEAARRFARYWRVVGPCSAALRVRWLRAIGRRLGAAGGPVSAARGA